MLFAVTDLPGQPIARCIVLSKKLIKLKGTRGAGETDIFPHSRVLSYPLRHLLRFGHQRPTYLLSSIANSPGMPYLLVG